MSKCALIIHSPAKDFAVCIESQSVHTSPVAILTTSGKLEFGRETWFLHWDPALVHLLYLCRKRRLETFFVRDQMHWSLVMHASF